MHMQSVSSAPLPVYCNNRLYVSVVDVRRSGVGSFMSICLDRGRASAKSLMHTSQIGHIASPPTTPLTQLAKAVATYCSAAYLHVL